MKEATGFIKLQVPAGSANPAPPVGPALGQKGLNIMDFCNQFNAATADIPKNDPVPVVISVYKDRSFSIQIKTPPASFLIKKYAGLKKGSSTTGKTKVGKISMSDIRKISELKMPDLNAHNLEAADRMIRGTAVSMGIEVVEG